MAATLVLQDERERSSVPAPFSFRAPSFSLISRSDLSLETKPEHVPDLFVAFQEEEVQRSRERTRPSALFNDATGSSHELFIAAC